MPTADLRRRLDELPATRASRVARDAAARWRDDGSRHAAAASFHAVLAMAGVGLLGVVWDRALSTWMALLAGGIALAGAAALAGHVRRGLNGMTRAPGLPAVFDPFMRTRVLGFAAVCASGLAAMALLAMAAMLPTLAALVSERAVLAQVVLATGHLAIAGGVLGMLLHAMLRSLPDVPSSSQATQIGAACAAALMAVATLALGLQLAHSSIGSPLDVAADAVACVLWACLCMQCVLFAGAIAAAADHAGSRRRIIAIQPARAPSTPSETTRTARVAAAPVSIAAARARLGRSVRARPAMPPAGAACVVLRFPHREARQQQRRT
jgi:uncharacterized BrkB/YihY/UPF0761 family membrane protein